MESRRRLYKATQPVTTLSERVKKDRTRRNESRNARFAANRKIEIDLDESITTPKQVAPVKLLQIKDKPARLKAYIEQKRSAKLKEKLDERSPFIPYVPTGRWVEKKESIRKPKAFVITTPVKSALFSDGKILKKATIKEIITTTKKGKNAGASKKQQEMKSKKKILVETNSVQSKTYVIDKASSLNETFELLPNVEELSPKKTEEAAISLEIQSDMKENVIQSVIEQKKEVPKAVRAKIVVPVKRLEKRKAVEKMPVNKLMIKSKSQKQVNVKKIEVKKQNSAIEQPSQSHEVKLPIKKPEKKVVRSHTYKFYKSSLDNQVAYITIQLNEITNNMDSFVNDLTEDSQTLLYQTIQQADVLIKDKFKDFEGILEKFEGSDANDSKRITEDDVENYWILLYEQIVKLKENLIFIREAKAMILNQGSKKKRRTTRVHTLSETPTRRSRRIAEHADSPKHNPSCFGCTPLSSSKVNTPKSVSLSAKRRRTGFKKSIAFDQA